MIWYGIMMVSKYIITSSINIYI